MYTRAATASWGRLLAAIILIVLICAGPSLAYTQGDPEFRAFWVDAWHAGFLNSSQVVTLLGTPGTSSGGEIRAANCNAVFVEVRRDANVCYNSGMGEPYFTSGNFDALQAIINAAHDTYGGKKRVEVHAWLTTFECSGSVYTNHSNPADPANYWLTQNYSGTGQAYFDPGHPNALNYLSNVFLDVVNGYDIDGVHFDYIRFSNNGYGYNPTSISRYIARYGGSKPASTDEQFKQWRRDQVSALVRQIYSRVQAVKPQVIVSAATYCGDPAPDVAGHGYTHDAFTSTQPYKDWYSDWDQWVQDGILDYSVPMAYFDNTELPGDYTGWMNFCKERKANRQTIIGPGIYLNYLDDAITQLQHIRDASPNGKYASGMSGYSYYAPYVVTKPTGYGSWSTFKPRYVSDVANSAVDIPDRPWKSAPNKAHISGRVTIAGTGAWADGATVSVTGPSSRSQTSDGTGFYGFIDLTPGTYTVTATMAGYPPVSRQVIIATGSVLGNMYVNNLVLGCVSPVVSNVHVYVVSPTSETITWSTDVASTSQINYGLTTSYGYSSPLDSNLVTSHSVTLTGLSSKTLYHFQIVSARSEIDGGCTNTLTDRFFTTCGIPNTTNVQSSGITATGATITWNTDVSSNSAVYYGLTTDYGSTVASGTNLSSHSMTLTNLTPYSTYHYQVASDQGCGPGTSSDYTFTTLDQPVMTSVTDGTYTTSTTSIQATWSATDAGGVIDHYEYAVGSTSGGTQLVGWTSAGLATSYTISGLALVVGSTYYVSARAVNTVGATSVPMSSSGVTVATAAASVQDAKTKANGTLVGLPARVISAKWPGFFYIEDANRCSGIRVQLATALGQDEQVTVYGTMGLATNNERAILSPFVVDGGLGTPVKPVNMLGKAVAGFDLVMNGVTTPGSASTYGLNNVGLLIKMAGKVSQGVSDGFYLTDGNGGTDETNIPGVKVYTGVDGSAYEGNWLVVTGIASLRKPGATVPMILAREIQTL